jgi:hypothetical protein
MIHSLPNPKNEYPWSVNHLSSYTFDNQRAALSCHSKVRVLVGCIAEKAMDTLIAPFNKLASRESQQCLVLHILQSRGCMFTSCRSECIRRCDSKKGKCHARCHIHKMSNIRVFKILGFESQIIRQLCSKPNQ